MHRSACCRSSLALNISTGLGRKNYSFSDARQAGNWQLGASTSCRCTELYSTSQGKTVHRTHVAAASGTTKVAYDAPIRERSVPIPSGTHLWNSSGETYRVLPEHKATLVARLEGKRSQRCLVRRTSNPATAAVCTSYVVRWTNHAFGVTERSVARCCWTGPVLYRGRSALHTAGTTVCTKHCTPGRGSPTIRRDHDVVMEISWVARLGCCLRPITALHAAQSRSRRKRLLLLPARSEGFTLLPLRTGYPLSPARGSEPCHSLARLKGKF